MYFLTQIWWNYGFVHNKYLNLFVQVVNSNWLLSSWKTGIKSGLWRFLMHKVPFQIFHQLSFSWIFFSVKIMVLIKCYVLYLLFFCIFLLFVIIIYNNNKKKYNNIISKYSIYIKMKKRIKNSIITDLKFILKRIAAKLKLV